MIFDSDKRIIKGRPFEVDFDRSHQRGNRQSFTPKQAQTRCELNSLLNKKMEDWRCSPALHFQNDNFLVAAQFADQGEEWQIHGDDDAADDDAQEYDHNGLKGGQEVLHRGIHFFFIEVSDLG